MQRFFGIINQGMDYLEEADPDFEQARLTKRSDVQSGSLPAPDV